MAATDLLRSTGIIIHNQTVLLRGVNDKASVLAKLLNKLIEHHIMPYYVFQCRPVSRVKHHFQVTLDNGYKIFEEAKKKTKGHIMCRRLKYIMSHRTGKIEIIGILKNKMYFKYHQARDSNDLGKFFSRKLNKQAGWLDDLK